MTLFTEVGIICWTVAVQYLLTNCAQAKNITKAVQDLWDTNQKPDEGEKQFSRHMNDAFSHCDNVFSPKEVINMYVDGLTLALNSLI